MLGTDIIEIARIAEAAAKEGFVKKVFTEAEQAYYAEKGKNAQTYAGMFAAKEAVVKALKTGFGAIRHTDIEILHEASGAPYVKLAAQAAEALKLTGRQTLEISISHCQEYAVAVCMICR